MRYLALYVLGVVFVNVAFVYLPVFATPLGPLPAATFLVGFIFVLRDYAQRATGHRVLFAMAFALLLSWWMADPFVAMASAAAFAASELIDWGMYTWTKRPFRERVLLSSAVSTPVDSLVFLGMLGFASVGSVLMMTAVKMLAALIVWRLVR